MSNLIVVGISDMKLAKAPDVLITYALGSCVGTCLYDGVIRLGGMSHVLLPERSVNLADDNKMKYADTAIEELVLAMERAGAARSRLIAKIAGGATMFSTNGIGERNVISVKRQLARLGIRLVAEDTGSNYGRTLEFHPEDGTVWVKTVKYGTSLL